MPNPEDIPRYRVGVHDDQDGGVTHWFLQESPAATLTTWQLLQEYARPGVGVTVQVRGADGEWKTVNPPLITRPHDWPEGR